MDLNTFIETMLQSVVNIRMDKWPDENGLGGVWTIRDIIEIRYVHQLQHALRDCGFDKEIKIK